MSKKLTRTFQIEKIRSDAKKGDVIQASISSEFPVDRGAFNEVLRHTPDAVDRARFPIPVIRNHDASELPVGVAEFRSISNKKLNVLIRLSKKEKAIREDIDAGILKNLSVGYQIFDSHMEGDKLVATRWQPFEVSLVSIPADATVGIGRSYSFGESIMGESTQPEKLSRSQKADAKRAVEAERERVAGIQALGEAHRAGDLARKFIANGSSLDHFREAVLARIGTAKPVAVGDATIENDSMFSGGTGPYIHTGGGHRGYSIANLIQSQLDPRSVDAGHELEMSAELKRKHGKRGSQLLVPLGRSQMQHHQRAMTAGTATAGGHLVATDLHSDQFIDALIPASTVLNLGIMQLSDLQGDVAIPRADSNPGVSAYSLDSADTITPTDATLSQVTLSPRSLAATTVMSRKLVTQGSPDVESLVQKMLAAAIGAELDRQCIQGDGTGSNITGVVNVSGIGAITYANGGAPTWATVVNLESELTVDNIALNQVAYLVHPTMAATLKTTEKASGTARFLMEDGMMNSHPVHVTTNVPAGTVLIGAWSEFILGTWGVMAIDVDIYTGFRKGDVEVRCILDYDASVRHAQGFAVATEAVV